MCKMVFDILHFKMLREAHQSSIRPGFVFLQPRVHEPFLCKVVYSVAVCISEKLKSHPLSLEGPEVMPHLCQQRH